MCTPRTTLGLLAIVTLVAVASGCSSASQDEAQPSFVSSVVAPSSQPSVTPVTTTAVPPTSAVTTTTETVTSTTTTIADYTDDQADAFCGLAQQVEDNLTASVGVADSGQYYRNQAPVYVAMVRVAPPDLVDSVTVLRNQFDRAVAILDRRIRADVVDFDAFWAGFHESVIDHEWAVQNFSVRYCLDGALAPDVEIEPENFEGPDRHLEALPTEFGDTFCEVAESLKTFEAGQFDGGSAEAMEAFFTTRRNLYRALEEYAPPSLETTMDSVVDAISAIVTEYGDRGWDPDLMVGVQPPWFGRNMTVIVDATPVIDATIAVECP